MARHTIKASNLENNLNLFLITVYKTTDAVFENYCYGESEGYLCYEVIEELSVLKKLQVDEFMKDPQRCMREWMDKVRHDYKYPSLLYRDPINITELQTLINEAAHRR